MRVFYVEEDEKQEKNESRTFYVKLENIQVPDELKATKAIEANSVDDLMGKIIALYGFKHELRSNLELWSKPLGSSNRERLDTLDTIPKDYEDVWVRGVINNKAY